MLPVYRSFVDSTGQQRWSAVRVGLAVAIGLAAGCQRRPPSQPPQPSQPSQPSSKPISATEPSPTTTDLGARMRGQFVDGNALKDALVTGRAQQVNEVALRFVERHREEPFPARWQPRIDPFMEWAQAAADATDFETAAIAVANVSARCGECHRDEGVDLEFPSVAEPDAAQMLRYRFAIDRMWEGLVAPDTQRWQQGAQAYARAVDCSALGSDQSLPGHHTVPCNSILAVAGAAQAAETMQARADSFAAVTFNCAGCHGVERAEP